MTPDHGTARTFLRPEARRPGGNREVAPEPVSVEEAWGAELVVKVKEPQPAECAMLREGQVLFTYLHLAASEPVTRALLESGTTGVAYETSEAARILREQPAPPCTPDSLILSVDGAMIPLVHGQWTGCHSTPIDADDAKLASPPVQNCDDRITGTEPMRLGERFVREHLVAAHHHAAVGDLLLSRHSPSVRPGRAR